MAGYYRFTFGATQNSDMTVAYSTDGNNWTTYSEPGWPPSPQNRGSVLTVSPNDTVYIQLSGPNGWSLSGVLQVVIARANSAASGQAYSPFAGGVVWMNPTGQMNDNVWQASLGQISLNPGSGQTNKFEITVAFNASLPNVTGPSYFSEDPEMDVEGM
jgi:hypothetical protein